MSEKHTQSGRRRFLKTAALAGGAATAAIVGGAAVAESAAPTLAIEGNEAPATKGYHVTPHIEAYYRLARQ